MTLYWCARHESHPECNPRCVECVLPREGDRLLSKFAECIDGDAKSKAAKDPYEDSTLIMQLDNVAEDPYEDSTLMMQLLRDEFDSVK